MPRRIYILPDHLANQIAAGEVVERPHSVVKELVENALDAGANRISVALSNGGKSEIRVADNGCGMGREDALLALDRHATSKLSSGMDLSSVRTLGFRGEALPSIASVSRLVLETAEREGHGTRVVVKGGSITGVESCARQVGTSISVRSLFFNTPARAKFLRSTAAETRAIVDTLTTLALAHPEVAFQLESNERSLLDLPAVTTLAARVSDLWGAAEAQDLIPVLNNGDKVSVSGLIEKPHSASTAGRRGHFFVNGRSFADRFLVRAVDRGYHTTIPPGVRPSFFIFLDVPDGEVDVNVHPTKAEVRFRYHAGIEQAIEEAVRIALQPLASAPVVGGNGRWSGAAWGRGDTGARQADAASAGDQMALFVAGGPRQDSTSDDSGTPTLEEPLAPPVMWQVHNTYIFAESRDGLIIVDQHSAHERVLYEELMRDWEGPGGLPSQRLLFPLTLRLSRQEHDVVEQSRGMLARIGFEIEDFGTRSVIVHAVPNPHPYFDAERCLRDMIRELTEGSELVSGARNQLERLALCYACKAAIKAGQPLSAAEISELFDRLFATQLPFHDIHGRPTVIQLPLAELHNRFKRGS